MNRFSLLALFASLMLVVAACGVQTPADPEPTDVTTEEPTEEATEEAAEEPTEEATEEAAEEPTEEATEEATEEPTEEAATDGDTIADVVSANEDFSILLTALQTAGLTETLSAEGPFTVFAPVNAAFEAVDEATLTALLEDQETLEQVLLYHVVEGEVLAEDVVGLDEAETVQGTTITITVEADTVMLNNTATVTETDIMASNGVIHVIDSVLVPSDVTLPEGTTEEDEMTEEDAMTEEDEMTEEETATP
jgi:uncharacterized surface protein with fasciclin (FAS1) repeats